MEKQERIQVLNDGADEQDFQELLQILRSFGEVEVLYDPSDPKDKDVTADEVVERYGNFKKRVIDEETGKDGSGAERSVSESTEGVGEPWRGSKPNETDTTISTAA